MENITLNGQPITFDTLVDMDLEVRCYCRRCFLHDDPGGCLWQED